MRSLALLLFAALLAGCTGPREAATPADGPADGPAERTAASDDPFKPYDEVVTDEAVTDTGVFTVHRVDEKLLFEIPTDLLGRDFLLISRIAGAPADVSPFVHAGTKTNEQVVRWERQDDRILLRTYAFNAVAADSLPVATSVRSNNFAPIVASFDIRALSPDSAAVVVDATDLYTKDVPALSGLSSGLRRQFSVRRMDEGRSYLEYARSFPMNVEVRHVTTFDAGEPPSNESTGTISMAMNQSMVLLPEQPMQPRLADERVGYFTVEQIDFGSDAQKADEREYIRRWHLEPSDPAAYARGELVPPVKPIVYYLDPATPERWRPYFCQGIEDWNRAFEAAGFRDAIECRLPPSPEEDPEFSPEDVRYSTLRYVANTTRNAMGPSVSDPRSGEIIESDIIWYHNHIRSYRNRLLIETAAANPDARTLNMPEELIGETMRQVIAHEIGHALGLPHNMVATSAYPVDSLRSGTFTQEYGISPTIMDYARQNYIAQPGDENIRFVRQLGPYDDYAVEWGYRVFPGQTTEGEKPLLDALIVEHADDPRYRFGTPGTDPRAQTEDLGDDPVKASTYAVANLQRVVPNLVAWTSTPGEGYEDLDEIYGELLGMWNRYVGHVGTVVGGVHETRKASDQEGPVYEVVPEATQREAVDWLLANVFETPTWLHDEDLLRRIESAGAVDRIRSVQTAHLGRLLDPQRLQRLIEAEVFLGDAAYTPLELFADVRTGVWRELAGGGAIDTYRRNLQRGYLEAMEELLTEELEMPSQWRTTDVDVSQSDIRPFVRGELQTLRAEVERTLRRTDHAPTRYHLQDVLVRIDRMLDPEG